MRSFRLAAVAASLLLTSIVVTACAASPEGESASPTPMFASDEEAFAAAEATYRAYVDALNAVDLADPGTFDDVFIWTSGELNAADRKLLSAHHAAGVRKTGRQVSSLVTLSSAKPPLRLFRLRSATMSPRLSSSMLREKASWPPIVWPSSR